MVDRLVFPMRISVQIMALLMDIYVVDRAFRLSRDAQSFVPSKEAWNFQGQVHGRREQGVHEQEQDGRLRREQWRVLEKTLLVRMCIFVNFEKNKAKLQRNNHTMPREIEKIRQVPGRIIGVPRIRQFGLRIPKLIEERMAHGLDRGQALGWSVFQQSRD